MTPPPDDIDALVATIHELATDPHYNRNGKSGCNAVMQQCACDCNWQELVIDALHEAADELARLRAQVAKYQELAEAEYNAVKKALNRLD